ncbi:MAG: DUF5009 domain-containing protein [bacterium]|nr:DUF5009 domain-containing protein [bacterium]
MILVNNPGSWSHVYPPLLHADWHGCTPTDLIFPFFLFIVGVALSFSFARHLEGTGRRALHLKILRRALIIFALGMLPKFLPPPADFSELRIAGVLQRIAVVYLATSLIVLHFSRRAQIWITAALLLGYWAAMALIPVPGSGVGVLTPEGNLAAWIDSYLLPGSMYRVTWDPEGLFSTVPAVATALLGVFTGNWLRSGRDRSEIAAGMFTAGWLAILAGLAWDLVFPLNKNLWTSSYVLYTAGAALEALAFCYWLIDVRGHRKWAQPAIVYGLNAITVFVASGLLTKLLYRAKLADGGGPISTWSWIYQNVFLPWTTPEGASLVMALSYVVFWWLLMAILYRRGIFIKV